MVYWWSTYKSDPLECVELVPLRVDGLLQVAVAVDQLLYLGYTLAVFTVADERHSVNNKET